MLFDHDRIMLRGRLGGWGRFSYALFKLAY